MNSVRCTLTNVLARIIRLRNVRYAEYVESIGKMKTE
jgi:hypothetical protein